MFCGHEVICLNSFFDVVAVNADGYSHEHVLWSLSDFAIDSQQVRSLLIRKTVNGAIPP